MKPVYQTRFGGCDSPADERGNCWAAAVASLLEIPLAESFDIAPIWDDEDWFDQFNTWLKKYGFVCTGWDVSDPATIEDLPKLGYHLIDAESTTLKNGEHHVLVGYAGEVVHDPNPRATKTGKVGIWFIFATLDPARSALVKVASK